MHIALIAGSNRKNAASTNMLRYMEKVLTHHGMSVAFVDLYRLQLPLYSPDKETLQPQVVAFLHTVKSADGLILATPEYHGSLSGTLKNALDYMDASLVSGKPVLTVSTAGGPLGTSSLTHLQSIVRNLHGVLCPEWISIGAGFHDFNQNGEPAHEEIRQRINSAVRTYLELVRKLRSGAQLPADEVLEVKQR